MYELGSERVSNCSGSGKGAFIYLYSSHCTAPIVLHVHKEITIMIKGRKYNVMSS